MTWETVIGLEVHVQLNTKSKLFSASSTTYGGKPNSHTSFVDAGLPGVLPVLNDEAVKKALRFGIAIDAEINNYSYFERKNYFYPDLPKGYQISQFQRPIIGQGHLNIALEDGASKLVTIERAHLEEDAGKSVHDAHPKFTGIDLNRAGTPLLEIVSAPCLYSAQEAIAYLKALHQLVRFLDISDGNMQEGSFRCDVNISLRPSGATKLGTRTELKNLNSFRFIEKAIQYEQLRHQDRLESGQEIIQETRLFSPASNTTHSMRGKESEQDYRYFPDPDLLPIEISEELLNDIKDTMPRLPEEIKSELRNASDLKEEDIDFLLSAPDVIQYFYRVQENTIASSKMIANWLKGPYAAVLNELGETFDNPPISAKRLATLLNHLTDNKLSSNQAKSVFTKLLANQGTVEEIIANEGFNACINQDELTRIVEAIIAKHPEQAEDFRKGKEKLLAFFVGQVMKETKGKANPETISQLIRKNLS
ncbi:Asp-tRNA(Asn)/Glu-tRNA(Gln) amidotransferase subunit GatB [Legionella impletisoli]|uniref:Aspartyl/glutamyl-tRNA(Asn/Gln) amidotransferase subunit B n=1 Tax=Legionella impletisoli TaxID=343510 RepID=A0A917JLJ5_9GAMM|nr:Asp-tRNA(Asn)/Glu-tRNA(Gln) amidotransferase subunit GatB [Legionella impletisoli]GGI75541.1 aspartyl/glutamyl-tRNA(Asn/Gln) amidotransferase subunit B [Legionella impletisoli]